MMLFQLFMKSWKRSNGWNTMADELAIQSVGPVRRRLGPQVERMSRNESRGYIRARARSVVKQTVESVAPHQQLPADLTQQLSNRVLVTATNLVHQQVINQPLRKPVRRVA